MSNKWTKNRILTSEQLASLEACTTAAQWREACDAIKATSDSGVSYPEDWWARVKQSGMMDRITARWGDDSELKVEKLEKYQPMRRRTW